MVVAPQDKGRMLWPRLNEKDRGLQLHACTTVPGTYRNFSALSNGFCKSTEVHMADAEKNSVLLIEIFFNK